MPWDGVTSFAGQSPAFVLCIKNRSWHYTISTTTLAFIRFSSCTCMSLRRSVQNPVILLSPFPKPQQSTTLAHHAPPPNHTRPQLLDHASAMPRRRKPHLHQHPLVQPRPHPHPAHPPHLDLPRLRRLLDHNGRKRHLLDPRLLAPGPRPQHPASHGRHRRRRSPRRPPRRRRRLAGLPHYIGFTVLSRGARGVGHARRLLAVAESHHNGVYLDGDPGVLGRAGGERSSWGR